jgi:signal transduction histidine kinase
MHLFPWKNTSKRAASAPRALRGEPLEARYLLSGTPDLATRPATGNTVDAPAAVQTVVDKADPTTLPLLDDNRDPVVAMNRSPVSDAPGVSRAIEAAGDDGAAGQLTPPLVDTSSAGNSGTPLTLPAPVAPKPVASSPPPPEAAHPGKPAVDGSADAKPPESVLQADPMAAPTSAKPADEAVARQDNPATATLTPEPAATSASTTAKTVPHLGKEELERAVAAIAGDQFIRERSGPASSPNSSASRSGGASATISGSAADIALAGSSGDVAAATSAHDHVFAAIANESQDSTLTPEDRTAPFVTAARIEILGAELQARVEPHPAIAPAAFTWWGVRNPTPLPGALLANDRHPAMGRSSTASETSLLLAAAPGAALATASLSNTLDSGASSSRAAGRNAGKLTVQDLSEGQSPTGTGSIHRSAIYPTDRARLLAAAQVQIGRLQTELAELKAQLERQARLAMVGQAAASIAHDLRNPLAVVRNASWLLKQDLPAEAADTQQYLDAIDTEVENANRIISNLMEAVRAKEPAKQAVDLGGLAREVFDRLQNRGQTTLAVDAQPEPFMVHADAVQLRQVLGNLLGNAVEALRGTGDIQVQARHESGFDMILVRDTGPGIPPQIRDTLFEPLVSTRAKGTGLGLAICRQIVERHGGTIELLPADGSGAAFLIRLPQATAPATAD